MFKDHEFPFVIMLNLRSVDTTNEEIGRQCPTPKSSVTIRPVVFKREKPSDVKSRFQEPIFIGNQNPSLQDKFRERFGGIRARIQSRRFS